MNRPPKGAADGQSHASLPLPLSLVVMKHSFHDRGSVSASWILAVAASFAMLSPSQAWSDDSAELARLFAADQAARSEENRKAGIYPTLQEERERRIAVMRLLAEGGIETAEDYIRAVVILQHTSTIVHDSGLKTSLSAENRILGFFLARRAHELGHESGAHFMAWAYNYWLRSCGLEIDKYGYELSDGKIVPMNPSVPVEESVSECGFDPSPYFDEVNNIDETSENAS